MNFIIEKSWKIILSDCFKTLSYKKLVTFVKDEYENKIIYPQPKDVFSALYSCSFDEVKVVVVGQDPYHNPKQAHGLCFSVPEGINPPPSLKNIYKEIFSDIGIQKDITKGDLSSWAEQGVLLLNSVLTVEENKPGSHTNHGWEEFTDQVIKKISQEKEHCVFLLWGSYAQKKGSVVDQSKHLVLESPHPSPLSAYRGFFGNKHFSQTNNYLKKNAKEIIQW